MLFVWKITIWNDCWNIIIHCSAFKSNPFPVSNRVPNHRNIRVCPTSSVIYQNASVTILGSHLLYVKCLHILLLLHNINPLCCPSAYLSVCVHVTTPFQLQTVKKQQTIRLWNKIKFIESAFMQRTKFNADDWAVLGWWNHTINTLETVFFFRVYFIDFHFKWMRNHCFRLQQISAMSSSTTPNSTQLNTDKYRSLLYRSICSLSASLILDMEIKSVSIRKLRMSSLNLHKLMFRCFWWISIIAWIFVFFLIYRHWSP